MQENARRKLEWDNFSEKELCAITDTLDCDYDGIFTYIEKTEIRKLGRKIKWLLQ